MATLTWADPTLERCICTLYLTGDAIHFFSFTIMPFYRHGEVLLARVSPVQRDTLMLINELLVQSQNTFKPYSEYNVLFASVPRRRYQQFLTDCMTV